MQIVIEISEELYEDIKEHGLCGYSYDREIVSKAISNGTSLPKGHGRLVDAENIDSIFHNKAFDLAESARYYDILWAKEIVCNAPTVIEADKAESEG